jgi:hypothetical protein
MPLSDAVRDGYAAPGGQASLWRGRTGAGIMLDTEYGTNKLFKCTLSPLRIREMHVFRFLSDYTASRR